MKVELKNAFAPITLTLESQGELDFIAALIGSCSGEVPKAFGIQNLAEQYYLLEPYISTDCPALCNIMLEEQ